MATTINASTSAGLVSTADTSGVLQLQTAGTTALTISTAQLATLAGGLNFSTLDAGITFNKTGALTNSTLNDYEAGTWTPGVSFGNGTTGITYNASTNGFYRKVGSLVMLTGYIQLTNKGSSTGTARITGLPFSSNSGTGEQGDFGFSLGYTANLTFTGQLSIYGGGGVTCLVTTINSGTAATNLTDTAFANTTLLVVNASYVSTT
jgi:hypothetical protein